ncbi:1617_t:CDS:2 [Funneliformis geosporum]|uniref:14792_t:CDS:1 n=1 Tax=Funneliformis geosporum TaxID=1117311 RepID=A0A9W4WUE5_9GLOM|nr:1617_t:CDS:2 [Funneliformis geosporum]CAI2172894.1 14792_t:CDS:2 [Funneliformis geosporum]
MTLETVYAIYPFEAEHDDEVPFQMGEPITVLEKDDLYRDGWWRGKNICGQIGLFPKNYTTYEKPNPKNASSSPVSSNSIKTSSRQLSPTSAFNMRGSDLDLPSAPFRRPSPSIDDTIVDIQNKLHRMGVRSEEEEIYQYKLNQQNLLWSPKNGHSNKYPMTSSSESSTSSSRISSLERQHSSQSRSVGNTKKVERSSSERPLNGHPMSWDVDQVCMWLSEKGFDSEIHHFIENDITGDVLLGLSLSTLKELDINSFGKRVRIMNVITELKSHYSENDDVSDFEEFNQQSTTFYPDSLPLSPQNGVYSNQAVNSSGSLFNHYSTIPNSLSHVEELVAFPKHLIDAQRNSTVTKNVPPTYYTYSRRVGDAEGSNIETVIKSPNKKSGKFLAKLSFSKTKDRNSINNTGKKEKARTNSGGGWDFNRSEEEYVMKDKIMKNKSAGEESASSQEMEKNRLKFVSNKKNRSVLDRSSLVGNQLGLPKRPIEMQNQLINSNSTLNDRKNNIYSLENIGNNINLSDEAFNSIGEADHEGYLKKQGEKYKTWNSRYCILKGINLYYFKNDKELDLSKAKGYINLTGYRIISDENILHGKYGFKLIHDTEKSHYFAHEDMKTLKGWIKAMMKSTIARDSKAPVISSSNIATIPLSEARKMTPRPPETRRPPVGSASINKVSSPILRPTSPISQRSGSPIQARPLTPTLQTFQNSSPLMRPFNNRSTVEFF